MRGLFAELPTRCCDAQVIVDLVMADQRPTLRIKLRRDVMPANHLGCHRGRGRPGACISRIRPQPARPYDMRNRTSERLVERPVCPGSIASNVCRWRQAIPQRRRWFAMPISAHYAEFPKLPIRPCRGASFRRSAQLAMPRTVTAALLLQRTRVAFLTYDSRHQPVNKRELRGSGCDARD